MENYEFRLSRNELYNVEVFLESRSTRVDPYSCFSNYLSLILPTLQYKCVRLEPSVIITFYVDFEITIRDKAGKSTDNRFRIGLFIL